MARGILSVALVLALSSAAFAQEGAKDDFKRERKEGDTSKDQLEGPRRRCR